MPETAEHTGKSTPRQLSGSFAAGTGLGGKVTEQGTIEQDSVAPEAPARLASEQGSKRLPWLLASLLLVWLPLLVVDIPPLADLPQHMAQIRQWQELLGWAPVTRDLTLLQAAPWQPNALVYLPALVFGLVAGPVVGGKLLVGLLLGLQVLALHALALRRQRPAAHAMLASLLTYNCAFYWAFANYLLAMPLLLLALCALDVPGWSRRKELLVLLGFALLLAWAHVLVFGMGALVLGLWTLVLWPGWRQALLRGTVLLPGLLYAGGFAMALADARAAAGFHLEAAWFTPVLQRLDLDWISRAILGGIGGGLEPLLTVVLFGWLAIGLWQARSGQQEPDRAPTDAHSRLDRPLLAVGVALLLWAWLAPDKYLNTIVFSRRFAPFGLMLALVALPPLRVPVGQDRLLLPLVQRWLPAGLLVLHMAATSLAWLTWQATDLSGLRPALTAIAAPKRVLGLDFVGETETLRLRVLLQQFAWAEAMYGGEGNFSFSEHGSSVVSFKQPRPGKWTRGLEWNAGKVSPEDLAEFDILLVAGDETVHARMPQFSGATPLTTTGIWRAYRLRQEAR